MVSGVAKVLNVAGTDHAEYEPPLHTVLTAIRYVVAGESEDSASVKLPVTATGVPVATSASAPSTNEYSKEAVASIAAKLRSAELSVTLFTLTL